jgi:hypothetical protein
MRAKAIHQERAALGPLRPQILGSLLSMVDHVIKHRGIDLLISSGTMAILNASTSYHKYVAYVRVAITYLK